jgi:hypothetical protein
MKKFLATMSIVEDFFQQVFPEKERHKQLKEYRYSAGILDKQAFKLSFQGFICMPKVC